MYSRILYTIATYSHRRISPFIQQASTVIAHQCGTIEMCHHFNVYFYFSTKIYPVRLLDIKRIVSVKST